MTKLKNWDTCIGLETSRVGWGVRGEGGGGQGPNGFREGSGHIPFAPLP